MKHRLITLDLLRIFAAFWVLCFHWTGHGGFYPRLSHKFNLDGIPDWLNRFASYGYLGVDIFFILSGVVIARSSLHTGPLLFAKHRFVRLYPVYFISILLAVIVAPLAVPDIERSKSLLDLIGLHFILGGETIVGAAWTLPFEIYFYLLTFIAISFSSIRQINFSKIKLFNFLLVWQILILILDLFDIQFRFSPEISGFGTYFILGATLSQIRDRVLFKRYLLILLPSLYITYNSVAERISTTSQNHVWSTLLLLIVVAILLTSDSDIFKNANAKVAKSVSILSLMTYPVYLFHETFGMSVISLLVQRGLSIPLSYGIVSAVVLLLSYISVRWIEPKVKRIIFG